MFQKYNDIVKYVPKILNDMYILIGSPLRRGTYAFKGGYVLSKRVPDNIRGTHDIDVDVYSEDLFPLVVSNITFYLEELKNKGVIYTYNTKAPKILPNRVASGFIKLYVKEDDDSRKKYLCGVDIGIKQSDVGVVLTPEGFSSFSNELMLADKLSVLFSTKKDVIRRCRDLMDIVLILKLSGYNPNLNVLCVGLNANRTNIFNKSCLEDILEHNEDLNRLNSELLTLLTNEERITLLGRDRLGLSPKIIIEMNLKFLYELRRCLNGK